MAFRPWWTSICRHCVYATDLRGLRCFLCRSARSYHSEGCKHRTARPLFQSRRFPLGGDKGDRTPDLLHAMQALSQLSYIPKLLKLTFRDSIGTLSQLSYIPKLLKLTFRDSIGTLSQLSYIPKLSFIMAQMSGRWEGGCLRA